MPFAIDFRANPKVVISSGTNGKRAILGDADFEQMGGLAVHFVNGSDLPGLNGVVFAGSLLVVGRSSTKAADDDNVPYVPVPFRALYLNGAPADGSLQPASTLITDTSIIVVPSMAMTIGVEVTVANGTPSTPAGMLYTMPLHGSVYP